MRIKTSSDEGKTVCCRRSDDTSAGDVWIFFPQSYKKVSTFFAFFSLAFRDIFMATRGWYVFLNDEKKNAQ